MAQFDDIAWVNVYTRGTRSTIHISETIAQQQQLGIPREVPCNIVAARDGLITSIITAAGMPKVRQNDVVRQGDLLVSGALPVEAEHLGQTTTIFVHAYAEVWAKMYTPIRFVVPLTFTEKIYSGKQRNLYSVRPLFVQLDAINLPHTRISFTNYDRIVSHKQPGSNSNYPLPLILTQVTYREYKPVQRQRSVEEAKALAERIITERIIREFDFQADIINKQVLFEEQPEGLLVNVIITTNERIDKAVPIEHETERVEDEGTEATAGVFPAGR